jgi:PadR family transcriptional regulator PadR
MVEREPYRDPIDLLQGTLDLLVLQALTWGPQHGYGIIQAIRATSREAFQVDTGSLYPALHRLEREGSVASEWKTSENKQKVKIYRLTAAGRRRLAQERSRWERLLDAMSSVLDASKAPSGSEA